MRRTILLLIAVAAMVSARAITQDPDGYYLLGSVDDWKAFAEIVATTNDANARMVADIDLGDDQTHIGSLTQDRGPYYKGIFDGQGFTLTVAYVGSSRQIVAPFTQTQNATIKNLHLAGSIQSVFAFVGVVGRCVGGRDVISNVWNSTSMTCNSGDWNWVGGLVGGSDGGANITISDCLFDGTMTCSNSYAGCFLGYAYNGNATITNCLSVGTLNTGRFTATSFNNCYVSQFPSSIPEAMQCTAEQLADGTIATALQAGRDAIVWTQDTETNQPMLAVFKYSLRQDDEGYYLLDSRHAWSEFAKIVSENPAANARMTRNIDLGDDQTMIGAGDGYFSGTFDGQGYTLTVAYNSTQAIAPFGTIKNSTIKDLHVDGTIHSSVGPLSCVALIAVGTENISTVWVSANVTSSINNNDWSTFGVIVGNADNGATQVNITDCLFSGTVTTCGKQNGFFLGYDGYYNRGTTTNCLSVGTFDYQSSASAYFPGTYVNTYAKQFKIGYNTDAVPEAMRCTDEQLADGTIATALQAGRTRKIWVQDNEYNHPIQKIFLRVDGDLNRDGIVDVDDVNILVNIILGIVSADEYGERANVDHKGGVDVGDINAVISIITGK